MNKYRKKPTIVKAVQWFGDETYPLIKKTRPSSCLCENFDSAHGYYPVKGWGARLVCPKDWVIYDDDNRIIDSCSPEEFKRDYELEDDNDG
jgi:hypothetical protein